MRATFSRIEQQYGVPGPVIVAIWGLETDFGANSGKLPDHPLAGDASPTIAAARTNFATNCSPRCVSSSAAT